MSTEATPENLRVEADWLESERSRDAEVDFGLLRAAADRIEELEAALDEINQLRSNVTATQSATWSNMMYPLVGILNRAGYIDRSDIVTVEQAAAHLSCYGGGNNSPHHPADDLNRQSGYQANRHRLTDNGWEPATARFRKKAAGGES